MINIAAAETENNLKPKLSVLGVGGAGSNAVDNMVNSELEGVDFIVANTDAQSLATSKAQRKIQLGMNLTKGLGAGANPEIGREAAEETLNEIVEALSDSNMVFVTAGMGGGTGSGAAPVICQALREKGILTVGVVTKPFNFEGKQRTRVADAAIEDIKSSVDTLIIIPNQNLFNIIDKNTTFTEAFSMADKVLYAGVSSITDLIVKRGIMNKDFADIKEIVGKMGEAVMGTGEAQGENRAMEAAEKAIANPLLDNVSMKGAKGVLINITGSEDITLFEVDEVTNRIREEIDSEDEAEFIIGTTIDDNIGDVLKVSIVATGLTRTSNGLSSARVAPVKIKRPIMDDGAQDITKLSFENEVVVATPVKSEEAVDDIDDIDIPVSLFSARTAEEEMEEKAFEEFEEAEDIPVVSDNFLKISENGEVIRPIAVEEEPKKEDIIPTKSSEDEKEKAGFFNRIMKPKDKVEEVEVVEENSKEEDFEDMELPGFLQRK